MTEFNRSRGVCVFESLCRLGAYHACMLDYIHLLKYIQIHMHKSREIFSFSISMPCTHDAHTRCHVLQSTGKRGWRETSGVLVGAEVHSLSSISTPGPYHKQTLACHVFFIAATATHTRHTYTPRNTVRGTIHFAININVDNKKKEVFFVSFEAII